MTGNLMPKLRKLRDHFITITVLNKKLSVVPRQAFSTYSYCTNFLSSFLRHAIFQINGNEFLRLSLHLKLLITWFGVKSNQAKPQQN